MDQLESPLVLESPIMQGPTTADMDKAIADLTQSINDEIARSIAVAKSANDQITVLQGSQLTQAQVDAVNALKPLIDAENPSSPTVIPPAQVPPAVAPPASLASGSKFKSTP